MTVNRIIEDKELGPLFVRVNARARRLTFRTKEDGIHVTVPPRTSLAEVENAIEQLRSRLRADNGNGSCPVPSWEKCR